CAVDRIPEPRAIFHRSAYIRLHPLIIRRVGGVRVPAMQIGVLNARLCGGHHLGLDVESHADIDQRQHQRDQQRDDYGELDQGGTAPVAAKQTKSPQNEPGNSHLLSLACYCAKCAICGPRMASPCPQLLLLTPGFPAKARMSATS